MMFCALVPIALVTLWAPVVVAQAEPDQRSDAREGEAALNEDPEAQRRSQVQEQPELFDLWPSLQFYGSARLHVINNLDLERDRTEISVGDGASRVGARVEWKFSQKWRLFGRGEAGFDVLDTFTPKGTSDDGQGLDTRLVYGGLQSDDLIAVWGKNWSAYYQIAGMADRFSIFGGQAAGVYNAGTDGGATGTGRADDVLQARIYTNWLKAIRIKPFNLNLQFQEGQPIPHVPGVTYGKAYGASAWLETQADRGIGLAWTRAEITDLNNPAIQYAGISDHATAFALATRMYGDRWYAALVLSRLKNVETTDRLKYIDALGAELYLQWQIRNRWWLIAGGNWLDPDNEDRDAGEFKISYAVLGLRYTLDSFNRMLYAEYRFDQGRFVDGTGRKNEFTVGFRWDFDY